MTFDALVAAVFKVRQIRRLDSAEYDEPVAVHVHPADLYPTVLQTLPPAVVKRFSAGDPLTIYGGVVTEDPAVPRDHAVVVFAHERRTTEVHS